MKVVWIFFVLFYFGQGRAASVPIVNSTIYDLIDISSHDNESTVHGSNHTVQKQAHGSHKEHGIHLVSIQYDYVSTPLLIAVFLFSAAISKLGM